MISRVGSKDAPGEGPRACRYRRPDSRRQSGGEWRPASQRRPRCWKERPAEVRRRDRPRDDGRSRPGNRGRVVPAVCGAGRRSPADDRPDRSPAGGAIGQSLCGPRGTEPGCAVRGDAARPDHRRRHAMDRSRIRRGFVLRRTASERRARRHPLRREDDRRPSRRPGGGSPSSARRPRP